MGTVGITNMEGNSPYDSFRYRVNGIFQKVDELEQRVIQMEQFYSNTIKKQPTASKGNSTLKDKDKDRHVPSIQKQQQEATKREAAAAKRMQELIRRFG